MEPAQAFRNSNTERSKFFAKLKPCCLEIVKALRKGNGSQHNAADVAGSLTVLTDQLYNLLNDQIGYDASVLDSNLADYAFFPLLPIFQRLENYPARLVENATKCLRVLMQYGWKTALPKESAQKFLILLTLVVTGDPAPGTTNSQNDRPEETIIEGYRALAVLMRTAGSGPTSPLTAANVVPALAHAVTVMLEGVTASVILGVQLAALEAVEALYITIKDQEALASFLPGTVSGLVRAVSSPGTQKAPKKVVIRTLEVLFAVIVATLGDLQTRNLHPKTSDKKTLAEAPEADDTSATLSTSEQKMPSTKKQKLDASWLQATSSQVKLALTTVLKLRNHESEDVRDAVQQFCVGLLDECHTSLSDCTSILVESAIVTARDEGQADEQEGLGLGFQVQASAETGFRSLGPRTTLQALAIVYPELGNVIQDTAQNWATSMSRVMQSSDEEVKQRAIRNLQKAISTLESVHIDSTRFRPSLAEVLRDSIVTLALTSSSSMPAVNEADTDDVLQGGNLALLKPDTQLTQSRPFQPVLLALGSQKGTRDAMLSLLLNLGPTSQLTRLAGDMLTFVRESDGLDQVAAYWLSFELVKASFVKSADIDQLLDLGSYDDGSGQEAVLDELFSFSVSQLDSHSDAYSEGDWRIDALALEVTAFAASRMKESFRPELIDVLYPVATYLGSSEARLRSHAVITLNTLAASCGYSSVSELIIDNVDYMLNSVSLKLNQTEISPASTKVLTMMIRLAGPRLIPFLDDVVAAIFAALDNYHGYPLFVESLFAVLGEVVQQSVKSDRLLLENGPLQSGASRNRKRPGELSTTKDLVDILDRRAKRRRTAEGEEHEVAEAGHPERPWKSEADELLRKHETEAAGEENQDKPAAGDTSNQDLTKPEDPKTPTYALLARITTLMQHYLTSPTPTLRKSLLDLLATVSPALAGDENAFLPLVNAIWPVVITRLYDGEPYVVIAACHALGALCGSAGDFLSTRIKAEWHATLRKWSIRAKTEAAGKIRASGSGEGSSSSSTAVSSSAARVHGRSPAGRLLGNSDRADVLLPIRSAAGGDSLPELRQVSSSLTSTTADHNGVRMAAASTGLGRFTQAVQIWEAVAGLLTDVVSYVKLDEDVYDEILDLLLVPATKANGRPVHLVPVPEEQRAREALEAVNSDAVWLAQYRAGQIEAWMTERPPVLEGVSFVSVGNR